MIENIEYATFRASKISHTDKVQYWISVVYLKPGNLCLSQDLTHNNQPTPDIAPYFNVPCVWVAVICSLSMLLLIKIKAYGFF